MAVREGHKASTRVEGTPYPPGHAPCLVGTSCALRTPFSCTILLSVGKNSLYNLPKVFTIVSRKYPLSLLRAIFLTDLEHHDITLLQERRQGCLAIEDRAEKRRTVGDYVLLFKSRLRFFVEKLLSKWEGPYVIEEVYRSGAIKINNFEGTNPKVVNGQRIKHYISGNPLNVETNIIDNVTPEEYIRDTFQNDSDLEKEEVCGAVSKPTPKQF